MSEISFSCKRCGDCCHGKGGIILGKKDLKRLCAYFQLDVEEFLDKYTENHHEKACLTVGEDGYCSFFKKDVGCGIHDVRPDVCRAWPYFRGNLIDEVSFEMAKLDCHGINKNILHIEFAQKGFLYLKENGLLGSDKKIDGFALIVSEDELPQESDS